MTFSTRALSRMSFTSHSRVCLRATLRELTSRTQARAVSDDLAGHEDQEGRALRRPGRQIALPMWFRAMWWVTGARRATRPARVARSLRQTLYRSDRQRGGHRRG